MEDAYGPEMTSDECYATLNGLKIEAEKASKVIEKRDPALAAMLSSLYIAQQNQMTILWHMIHKLEKKNGGDSIGETYNKKRW